MREVIEELSGTQKALVAFFGAAALLCSAAGTSLLFPETPLSVIWRVKPDEFARLIQFRPWSGVGLMLLSALMSATAWGCLLRRRWAWRMALAIFVANGLGDLGMTFTGRIVEGSVGIAIVTAIIIWLTRSKVRLAFQ